MTTPRSVIALGALFGIAGAAGQIWLLRFGAVASAPLRTMLSLLVAILIGVVAGTRGRSDGVKIAGLMGIVAGAILTIVGLSALLMDPTLIGQNPLVSAESFLYFVSSLIAGTAIASWLIAGVAVLVAWPVSLAQVAENEG